MKCGGAGHTGIYGWRKRCLYAVLLLLLVTVLGNLGATLLLINTIHFNFGGLGDLEITADGVKLRDDGVSHVYDSLATPRIASRPGRPLYFAGGKNLSAVIRDPAGLTLQSLDFYSASFDSKRPAVSVTASRFSVADLFGKTLFSAAPGRVTVGVDLFKVIKGGVHFSGSVQTSMVRSSTDLLLESVTRRLRVTSPGEVTVESRASDISASCLTDFRLTSTAGRIKMKAPGVYFPHLESLRLRAGHGYSSRPSHLERGAPPRSYQICVCSNGKLFVSRPDGECAVDSDRLQCR